MKGQFGSLIVIIIAVIIVLIGAYLAGKFLNLFPVPHGYTNALYAPIYNVNNSFFGIFDNSFIFIFLVIMAVDIYATYRKPSALKGFINIFLLLSLAFFSLIVRIQIILFNSVLNFSTLLPNTYAFFNNDYYLVITFFALIVTIILDFRGKTR